MDQSDIFAQSDGSMLLGNVISTIGLNQKEYKANVNGIVLLPDLVTPDQLNDLVKKAILNGVEYLPEEGVLDLGALAAYIIINGQTTAVKEDGTIDITDALEKFISSELEDLISELTGGVTSIKLNGAIYRPNANGLVDLGTIEAGGGNANSVYTGTTPPADTLGLDHDFYYQFL